MLLVLATALISGLSIFINKLGVSGANPFMFALVKNAIVSMMLASVIILIRDQRSILRLDKRSWARLALVGLVGGSIPFLLFFWGLSMTSAVKAAALHKLIFIPATLLGIYFMKEKFTRFSLLGAFSIVAGIAISGGIYALSLEPGDILIMAAVLLWSVEMLISKKALNDMKALHVAFGRMFFGAAFMLPAIALSGNFALPAAASYPWVLLTSLLLFGYVATWYNGLQRISMSLASSLLALSVPITALLSLANGIGLSEADFASSLLILAGAGLWAISALGISKIPEVLRLERNPAGAVLRPESE